MENWPNVAAAPAAIRHNNCFGSRGAKLTMIKGRVTRQEKAEKQRTIIGVLSPFLVAFLTNTYAVPAPNPPYRPISAGIVCRLLPVGLTISIAPAKAIRTAMMSRLFGFSYKMGIDNNMAKKGDSLLSMLASAIFSLSIA